MAILFDKFLSEGVDVFDLDYAQKFQDGRAGSGPRWYIVTVNALGANDSPEMR